MLLANCQPTTKGREKRREKGKHIMATCSTQKENLIINTTSAEHAKLAQGTQENMQDVLCNVEPANLNNPNKINHIYSILLQ